MPEGKNRYHYDLKNVHYAKATKNEDGTLSYHTPKRLPGAMSMDISAEGDVTKVRADGIDYIVVSNNNGYSGSITMVQISDEFKLDCLAESKDEENLIQYEDANAEPSPFALLFEFVGDKKNKRHVVYNCTASRPSMAGENKDSQKEPDTEELELAASPAILMIGGEERSIVKANSIEDTKPESYKKWYTQVITPGKLPEVSAELSDLSLGAATLTPEFTPGVISYAASTNAATNTIRATAVDPEATVEIKNGNLVVQNGASVSWTAGENIVTIKVTNGSASETYTITVTKGE